MHRMVIILTTREKVSGKAFFPCGNCTISQVRLGTLKQQILDPLQVSTQGAELLVENRTERTMAQRPWKNRDWAWNIGLDTRHWAWNIGLDTRQRTALQRNWMMIVGGETHQMSYVEYPQSQ